MRANRERAFRCLDSFFNLAPRKLYMYIVESSFYLKNIDSLNLFFIIKESEINLAKEGIFSHISYFHKNKCHNLFNKTAI